MSEITTILKLSNELEALCDSHDQLRTFRYGEFLDIIKESDIQYSLAHLNIRLATKNEKSIVFQLLFSVMDSTTEGNENIDYVESNMLQVWTEIYNIIAYSPRWQEMGVVTTPSTPQKFRHKGADVVTGWGGTILFEYYEDNAGYCDVPVTGYDYDAPVDPPVTGSGTYRNSDSSFTQSIPVNTTFVATDIEVTDSDGSTFNTPANKDVVCTPGIPNAIVYNRPIPTGQKTIYVNFDDGWHASNGTYDFGNNQGTLARLDFTATDPFLTLIANNAFNNNNRFTDELGTQVYANSYLIDHLTGLGWKTTVEADTAWATLIGDANSRTFNGFSDWRCASMEALGSIKYNEVGKGLNYSPWSVTPGGQLFTSTTDFSLTTFAQSILVDSGIVTRRLKTDSRQYLICRNHYA